MKNLLIVLAATSQIFASVVSVGAGSYSDALPPGLIYPTNSDSAGLSPAVTPAFKGAIPTNDWASSLAFQRSASHPHPYPMFPHPWSVKADSSGLVLGYAATASIGGTYFAYGTPWDISVGVPSHTNSATKLAAASDWSVTASLYGDSLLATFGHGFPYVFIQKTGPVELKLAGAPVVYSNDGSTLVFSLGERHYAAYAPTGRSWSVSGQKASADLGNAGYLSIAVLPDLQQSTLNLFKAHAYAFITDTRVVWSYDSTAGNSVAEYSFSTVAKEGGERVPLIGLYPHQWRRLTDASLTDLAYETPRGKIKLLTVTSFRTETPLPALFPILPFAAPSDSKYDSATMEALLQAWGNKTDAELVRRHADTYWTGKDLGRLAILTQLADASGNQTLKTRFLGVLRATLENWLTYTSGETNECFAHEPLWGSLIGLKASYGSGDELNDHHFHYGYFLMAAATVARMVPDWGRPDAWGGMVALVAKDVANTERGDDFSPFLRNFDPYEGHSWASGHANFGDGNNQESSSESLNFSAGLTMWGEAVGDTALRNLGTFLYATEVQAVREYWFDVTGENFPASWGKTTAGMIWGGKVDHATWFSASPEKIHGINWLPLTGASLYLDMDSAYAAGNYAEMVSENGGAPDEWKDIAWEYLSFTDPGAAWTLYKGTTYTPEDGESEAHLYAHILSMSALGALDTSIRGDLPTSGVFLKNGERVYWAYNPSANERVVRFTSGKTLTVPAYSWNHGAEGTLKLKSAVPFKRSLEIQKKARSYDLLGRILKQRGYYGKDK